MVDLKDIEYIFDSIIYDDDFIVDEKCGQRLRLQNPLTDKMDGFNKEIQGKLTETAIFIGDDGKELGRKDGSKSRVEFSKKFFKEMFHANNDAPYNIDHNHPNPYGSLYPTCFSFEDMERVVDYDKKLGFLCKSMNVEDGFNGSRMSLIRGDDFRVEDTEKFLKLAQDFEDDAIRNVYKFNNERDAILSALVPEDLNDVKDFKGAKLLVNLHLLASKTALKDSGYDETVNKYKSKFREINCNLEYSHIDINTINDSDTLINMAQIVMEEGGSI